MSAITTVWQFGSSNPDNATNLATIRDWWASQNGKKINWRQRMLPGTIEASSLNWEPQRFDEAFVLAAPEMRGITLYWRKADMPDERSTTPDRLEFDPVRQQLYIFPKSQQEVVIRVESAEMVYQGLKLKPSKLEYVADLQTLILRDELRRVEIEVTLTPELVEQLKGQL